MSAPLTPPITEAELHLTPANLAEIRETIKKNLAIVRAFVAAPPDVPVKGILLDPTTAQVLFNLALTRVEELQLLQAGRADGSRAH